jgi:hypothetical protein
MNNAKRVGLKSGRPDWEIQRAAIPYLQNQQWCALLQPAHTGYRGGSVPHPRRPSKQIFVVVASDDRSVWEWKGLLELDNRVVLPQFITKDFLIG